MTASTPSRYSSVAIILHWLIAIMLVSMVFVGWWMEDLREALFAGQGSIELTQSVYNWHKTAGIVILVLSLGRLGWRLTHPAPPLPAGMKPWEKLAASLAHYAFYGVMIGAPIMGWITASASSFPSKLFNLDGVLLPHLPVPQNPDFEHLTASIHGASGWIVLVLLALHAGAALKHHFLDRDGVLTRMIPGLNIPPQTHQEG